MFANRNFDGCQATENQIKRREIGLLKWKIAHEWIEIQKVCHIQAIL